MNARRIMVVVDWVVLVATFIAAGAVVVGIAQDDGSLVIRGFAAVLACLLADVAIYTVQKMRAQTLMDYPSDQ